MKPRHAGLSAEVRASPGCGRCRTYPARALDTRAPADPSVAATAPMNWRWRAGRQRTASRRFHGHRVASVPRNSPYGCVTRRLTFELRQRAARSGVTKNTDAVLALPNPARTYNRPVSDLPLAGVRVCDLTWIIAGPTATRVLADFGADVLRVEHGQAADPIRLGRPILGDKPTLNNSGFFNYFNRNKRSILLNVRHPLGMELLHKLIAVSDVVIENFSSGVLDSWELSYEAQKAINPGII